MIIIVSCSLLINSMIPGLTVLADSYSGNSSEVSPKFESTKSFIGEDGNTYTEKDIIDAFNNNTAVVKEVGIGIQSRIAALGALGAFVGSSISIPGIGLVVVSAAGLVIGGVVIFKAGSWVWNKAKAYYSDESNWTADQIISKKRKGSIRREFPGEYLGKTLKEINRDAKKGKARARKAKKLLEDRRFKK